MFKLNKKIFCSLILVCLAGSFSSGCSSSANTANTANASNTSSSKKLVAYSAGPDNLIKEITAGFEKETGIKVEVFSSTNGKVLSRMKAEKDNPKADIASCLSFFSYRS